MKICCIGDSLTAGYGVAREKCWFSLCRTGSDDEWINMGMNGSTSLTASAGMKLALGMGADAAVLMIGTNDFIINTSPAEVAGNVMHACRLAGEAGVCCLLAVPPPVDPERASREWVEADYAVVNRRLKEYGELLKKHAAGEELVFLLNLQEVFADLPSGAAGWVDGVHPDSRGHGIIAEALLSSGLFRFCREGDD